MHAYHASMHTIMHTMHTMHNLLPESYNNKGSRNSPMGFLQHPARSRGFPWLVKYAWWSYHSAASDRVEDRNYRTRRRAMDREVDNKSFCKKFTTNNGVHLNITTFTRDS